MANLDDVKDILEKINANIKQPQETGPFPLPREPEKAIKPRETGPYPDDKPITDDFMKGLTKSIAPALSQLATVGQSGLKQIKTPWTDKLMGDARDGLESRPTSSWNLAQPLPTKPEAEPAPEAKNNPIKDLLKTFTEGGGLPSLKSLGTTGIKAGATSLLGGAGLGEAAGVAGEAALGAAGGPIGLAAVAATELAKPLFELGRQVISLPGQIKDWGNALLDSQRNVAEFSAQMSAVFARKDVFEALQKQRVGAATAGGAAVLEKRNEELSKELEIFSKLGTNIYNAIAAASTELTTYAVQAFKEMLKISVGPLAMPLEKLVDWLAGEGKIETDTTETFLTDWQKTPAAFQRYKGNLLK